MSMRHRLRTGPDTAAFHVNLESWTASNRRFQMVSQRATPLETIALRPICSRADWFILRVQQQNALDGSLTAAIRPPKPLTEALRR